MRNGCSRTLSIYCKAEANHPPPSTPLFTPGWSLHRPLSRPFHHPAPGANSSFIHTIALDNNNNNNNNGSNNININCSPIQSIHHKAAIQSSRASTLNRPIPTGCRAAVLFARRSLCSALSLLGDLNFFLLDQT